MLAPPLLAGLREASRALMAADVQTAEKALNAQFPQDSLLADHGGGVQGAHQGR